MGNLQGNHNLVKEGKTGGTSDLTETSAGPVRVNSPALAIGDPAELLEYLLAVSYPSRDLVQWLAGQKQGRLGHQPRPLA